MTSDNKQVGLTGERLASDFLKKKGYKLIGHNFLIRGGEIDLIVQDHETVVFVEVKTRRTKAYGLPEEAVTSYKIAFLKRASQFYCARYNLFNRPLRIDVVVIELNPTNQVDRIEHIIDIAS